jgi:hypothetical protein
VLDPLAGPRVQYPVLALEPGKILHLAYFAGSSNEDPAAQVRRSRSTDGVTFAPTRYVYSPVKLETSRSVVTWDGDYMGAGASAGNVFIAFADNGAGAPHVTFYRSPSQLAADPMEPALNIPDAGQPDLGCYSGAPFTPLGWAPPTPFGQGACSAAQLSAYVACANGGDCSAFRADATNAACLACIETDVGAAQHGPMLTRAMPDGGREIVEPNSGGCQAHYDGMTDAGSCGNQEADFNDCVYFECGSCSDIGNPADNGPTYYCYFRAISVGVCSQHRETSACYNETLDGGSASCSDFATFLPLWCGM